MIPAGIRAPFSNPTTSLATALIAIGLAATAPEAHAQTAAAGAASQAPTGLWLTTPYPEFSAQAGKDVSVPLSLANRGLPPQRVELGVDGLPDGWKWEIDGGGKPVTAAIAGSDGTVGLTLKLTPKAGDVGKALNFAVSGKAGSEALKLPMEMTLAKTEPAKLTLEPKLPALRGTAKSAFDFQVDIKNEGQVDFDRQPTLEGAIRLPGHLQAGLRVAGTDQPAVEGRGIENALRQRPAAGQCRGRSVSRGRRGQRRQCQRRHQTAARYHRAGRPFRFPVPEGRLSGDATAGQERTFTFTLSNSGSAPARDVKLSASPPSGWKVAFNPEKVDEIAPGATSNVGVSMTPSDEAIAGDYMVIGPRQRRRRI